MRARLTAAAIAAALVLGAGAPVAQAAGDSAGAPTDVRLSTARGDAPLLRPGMYQTARPTGQTTRYAKIHRPRGGSVAVAIFGDVDASITTADGRMTCSSSSVSLNSGVTGYTFVFVDGADTKRQSYRPADCGPETDLMLTVAARSSSSSDATPAPTRPVRLAVTVEPRLADAGTAATKSQLTKIAPPSTSTDSEDRTLSSNFAAPTTLTPGSYPVSLRPDETVVARVRVGWGQRLTASVDAPRNGTNFAPDLSLDVLLAAFSPQWAPVGSGDRYASIYKNDSTEKSVAVYSAPVRAANRNLSFTDTGDADTTASQWATVAGWYYVAIRMVADDDKETPKKPLPARLNLAVIGTATSGPSYAGADGSAVAAPPATELSQGGSTGSGSSTTTLLRVGGTALVLVIAGAAVAILLRRRA